MLEPWTVLFMSLCIGLQMAVAILIVIAELHRWQQEDDDE